MGIPMIAKRLHVYAGHNYKLGQEFEAQSESNARFLEHVGHAQRAPKKEAAAAYQTRALVAATPPPAAPIVARTPAPTASAFAERKTAPAAAAPKPRATRPATQGDKE